MEIGNLKSFMLKDHRQYFVDKVKAPLMKALIILANRYPEPTKENTFHPNTHVWIDIWDKFFEHEDDLRRKPLFRALSRIVVDEHEHDPYYRDRMQVILETWLEEVLKGNWKPRSLDHPDCNWKSPNVRGAGYEFLKDRFYHKEKHNGND